MLTQRQWNQCRAALQFWLSVARTSSIHPIEHCNVRPFFEDSEHTPLTPGEIAALVEMEVFNDVPILNTIRNIAQDTGHSPHRILSHLESHGIKPEMHVGNAAVYQLPDLLLIVRELDALKEHRHQQEARQKNVSAEEYQTEKSNRSAKTRKGREALWASIRRQFGL